MPLVLLKNKIENENEKERKKKLRREVKEMRRFDVEKRAAFFILIYSTEKFGPSQKRQVV